MQGGFRVCGLRELAMIWCIEIPGEILTSFPWMSAKAAALEMRFIGWRMLRNVWDLHRQIAMARWASVVSRDMLGHHPGSGSMDRPGIMEIAMALRYRI